MTPTFANHTLLSVCVMFWNKVIVMMMMINIIIIINRVVPDLMLNIK